MLTNMLRVRCSNLHPVSVLSLLILLIFIPNVNSECWYNDEIYEEGMEVITTEPCLNCTCTRGVLLCYLRVCPTLPNPPPLGCILLHKFQTCCPELICKDGFKGSYYMAQARAEPYADFSLQTQNSSLKATCVVNGTVYAPGSAMDSSSLCEYCYCLGGSQVCVKPKCLLPLENCQPVYDSTSCCPVSYNCKNAPTISTTTTVKTTQLQQHKGGCLFNGIFYKEGSKVLDVGYSKCDNCYCLKGILRCEALSCAPPLLGCSPILKEEDCCAVGYNCSSHLKIGKENKKMSEGGKSFYRNLIKTELDVISTETTTISFETTTDGTTEMSTETTFNTETTTELVTDTTTMQFDEVVTMQTVLNSTDCIQDNSYTAELKNLGELTEEPINQTEPVTPKLALEYNLTKIKNVDYDYDYHEATLPPSLPNLQIIPFVAADAVDSQEADEKIDSNKHLTDFIPQNLFSPPVETEGGFVPKEPSSLENFYENSISSTTIPLLQNAYCIIEEKRLIHGESIYILASCEKCLCFRGDLVCDPIQCSALNCQVLVFENLSMCCPQSNCDISEKHHLIEDVSSSTELNSISGNRRIDETSSTLAPQNSTKSWSFDSVLDLLFNYNTESTTTKKTLTTQTYFTTTPLATTERIIQDANLAILKLAGCNIYGRMYRVGRIISELSNPCLECKCTESGVQCRTLIC